MAVETFVGNGQNTLFWTDRWLGGKTMAELALHLFQAIPKRIIKEHTVAEALVARRWVTDIRGALSVQILTEYLFLWDLVEGFSPQQNVTSMFGGLLGPVLTLASRPTMPFSLVQHPLCSLETNMEIMGSCLLQVLHLACSKESLLDDRLTR